MVCQSQLPQLHHLHKASPFIGTSIYNEEADHDSETIICEVEDEGRPSRIVDGEFSVSLERYFKVTVLDLRVTFEVLCQEATNSLDSYVKRGLLVTQCLNVLAVANEQVKKDDKKDEDPYLSEEIKNESPQYDNSIWVTGRMKINLSDSHCKLVPD